MKRIDQLHGFLNIHKPSGMSSHDVVNRVRRILSLKHVGHGGTLDPLAEGVLPIALGNACRLLRFVPTGKCYKADVLFGRRTTTDDTEGDIIDENTAPLPDYDAIKQGLQQFLGEFDQIPPLYSAIHHDGKRLYELARAGIVVADIKQRKVRIDQLQLLDFASPVATMRVRCGGGTYIRSIARDLGDALGCGACLCALLREQSGPFKTEQSCTLQQLEQAAKDGRATEYIIAPLVVLLANPILTHAVIDDDAARRIKMGQQVEWALAGNFEDGNFDHCERRVLVTCNDMLVAICRFEFGRLHPEVVIDSSAT